MSVFITQYAFTFHASVHSSSLVPTPPATPSPEHISNEKQMNTAIQIAQANRACMKTNENQLTTNRAAPVSTLPSAIARSGSRIRRSYQRFATVIALITLTAPAAHAAKTGELAMKLSVVGRPEITAYEPVVLRQELTNTTDHDVSQQVQPDYTTRIEVRDAEGKLVCETPLQPIPLSFLTSIREYSPGQARLFYLTVSALCTFTNPGNYTITASEGMMGRDGSEFDAISSASTTLRVLPYDAKRLDVRSKEALERVLGRLNTSRPPADKDIPFRVTTQRFYSIRHDAVLPYLAKYAENGGQFTRYAIWNMRRIGTEKARQMVESFTARQDEVGKEARNGLEMRLKISAYSWHSE